MHENLRLVFWRIHFLIMLFSFIDVPAQDGGWTDWTAWSSCSRTCKPPPGDLALKTRQRTCSNPPPALGGEDCKGLADDVELCNQDIPCGKLKMSTYR